MQYFLNEKIQGRLGHFKCLTVCCVRIFRSKILWVPCVVFKTDSYVDIRNLSYKSLRSTNAGWRSKGRSTGKYLKRHITVHALNGWFFQEGNFLSFCGFTCGYCIKEGKFHGVNRRYRRTELY